MWRASTADVAAAATRRVAVPPAGPCAGPDTPAGVCTGPRRSCAATTCVRDPAHAAGRDDRPDCSTESARGSPQAAVRNNLADGKKVRNSFSCVTTRRRPGAGRTLAGHAVWPAPDAAAAVAAARPRPAAAEPQRVGAGVVDAGRSASGVPASDTAGPDNTAGSNGVAGRRVRSPCADKHAAGAVACWRSRVVGR